jgi:hypothetical protein
MTTKTIKTFLIASMLIALAIMPIQSNALAISPTLADKVEDSTMVDFLNNLVATTGSTVKSKTLQDSTVVSVTNDVQIISENKYQVHILGTENGKTVNDQTIIITNNADGSINMINEKMGYNIDFHKATGNNVLKNGINEIAVSYAIGGPETLGSGSSNGSGARIDLYDSDYRSDGTTPLYLSDSYSGCLGANAGSFSGAVYQYSTSVSWNGNLSYWDWCINPHTFDRLDVTHEGSTHYYDGESYRISNDTYNHSGGSGTYSVDINMYYGAW